MKNFNHKATFLGRKLLRGIYGYDHPQLIISISEAHDTNMGLGNSEAYISGLPAFLTNSFCLQAVEWQCDEATKRACYSKGKSKVSTRQLFCFNKNIMVIADVIQCINPYLMHFYCLPF